MRPRMTLLTLTAFVSLFAVTASATPIISGDGESWTSELAAVCSQVGSGSPCGGTTVGVDSHPVWQGELLPPPWPLASWVSYADTGYDGAVLAPRAGSAPNLTGQTPIFAISESFTGAAGAPLFVRFWADDTLAVFFNDVLVKAPWFGQDYCSNQPIGCESDEYWDLIGATTGGLDVLRMVAYQVGTGTDTTSNPFGVLYSGTYTPAPPVPEPATLALFGIAAAIAAHRSRRRR
jgi:hypothetical protein